MTEATPLTPADCDLRDFGFMPVDVQRLLKSDTWILGSADERAAAISLWLNSWHQVPAASLPDNERVLEHLAGAKSWKKVRDHVLRGWVRCADGRWYHPVVAEKALEAWIEKLMSSVSGSVGNAKRWGIEIDTAPTVARILEAVELLRSIAPQSKTLRKKPIVMILKRSGGDQKKVDPRPGNGSPPDADDIASRHHEVSPPDSGGDSPPDRNRQGQGQGYVNPYGGGIAQGGSSDRAASELSPAAAALWEVLVASGIDSPPDDSRVAVWAAAGVTPDMLVTAIADARKRRAKAQSQQPVNVGFLDAILADALAARAAPSAAAGMPAGPWHTSWSGIVAFGRDCGLTQGECEPAADFRLRVFNAAGDGPWWDELNRAFRNTSGPVAAGAILENGR
ncbi:DUF1376 domain-containing protein [Burkholderia stagnalis]|uniref:DUF1376 domain-containing protein n=1 Tax=Burkholderia stagnalis TaxID=1503054 RepID=UPI000A513517|nr:DUF1376 domain-containing protein [Burkholderia stagnalis]